jgi:hypothetical protein
MNLYTAEHIEVNLCSLLKNHHSGYNYHKQAHILRRVAMAEGIQVTEQGVFIPRQVYQNFGEIEIVFEENYILIKPKNVTLQFSGFIRPRLKVEEILEDYELSLLAGES